MTRAHIFLIIIIGFFLCIPTIIAQEPQTNSEQKNPTNSEILQALKSLQCKIESLEKQNEDLNAENKDLKTRLKDLEDFVGDNKSNNFDSTDFSGDGIVDFMVDSEQGIKNVSPLPVTHGAESSIDGVPLGILSSDGYGIMGETDEPKSKLDERIEGIVEMFSWKSDNFKIVPFGWLEGEVLLANDLTVNRPYVLFARERGLTRAEQISVTGQSTAIGLQISGPDLGHFKTGGLILFDFHGPIPAANEAGAYFIRGYGELVNDRWRFAFGQMEDLIAPLNATTVNWTGIQALGNIGNNQRGMIRVEHYLYPHQSAKVSLQGALSQPVVTDFADDPVALGLDNGLPNFEGRVSLGLGPDLDGDYRFEVGLSGLYGETFAGDSQGFLVANTSQAYVVAGDLQWSGERIGIRGELFHGAGLGTYLGGIAQSLNLDTGDAIRSTGGWAQLWFKVHPRVTISGMFGVDDPVNSDLSPGQRSRNQLIGGNIFWDVTDHFQIGMDVWHIRTDYISPNASNEVIVFMSQAKLSF